MLFSWKAVTANICYNTCSISNLSKSSHQLMSDSVCGVTALFEWNVGVLAVSTKTTASFYTISYHSTWQTMVVDQLPDHNGFLSLKRFMLILVF